MSEVNALNSSHIWIFEKDDGVAQRMLSTAQSVTASIWRRRPWLRNDSVVLRMTPLPQRMTA
jgi:hypothetical protein